MTTVSPTILVLPRQVPHAAKGGAMLRNFRIIRALETVGNVHVFCVHIDHSPETPPPFSAHWHQYALSSGPARICATFLRSAFTRRPVAAELFYDARIAAALRRLIGEIKPDIVIFSEIWHGVYFPLVRSLCSKVVLDLHNIEFPLYDEMVQSMAWGIRNIRTRFLRSSARYLEPRMIAEADELWVCSEPDAALVRASYPSTPFVRVMPNVTDPSYYASVTPARDSTGGEPRLLFCANFFYPPNAEAAHIIIESILPLLRSRGLLPRVSFVGNHPTSAMHRYARHDAAVTVTGGVPDVRPYLAHADMVVIPLLRGGGTRLKVLEAFAARRPVVSTLKGVEGLAVGHNREVLIGNEPEDLANHIARLASEPGLSARLTECARTLLMERYVLDTLKPLMRSSIATLLA